MMRIFIQIILLLATFGPLPAWGAPRLEESIARIEKFHSFRVAPVPSGFGVSGQVLSDRVADVATALEQSGIDPKILSSLLEDMHVLTVGSTSNMREEKVQIRRGISLTVRNDASVNDIIGAFRAAANERKESVVESCLNTALGHIANLLEPNAKIQLAARRGNNYLLVKQNIQGREMIHLLKLSFSDCKEWNMETGVELHQAETHLNSLEKRNVTCTIDKGYVQWALRIGGILRAPEEVRLPSHTLRGADDLPRGKMNVFQTGDSYDMKRSFVRWSNISAANCSVTGQSYELVEKDGFRVNCSKITGCELVSKTSDKPTLGSAKPVSTPNPQNGALPQTMPEQEQKLGNGIRGI